MVFKKYQNMAKIVIKSILLAYQISAPIITQNTFFRVPLQTDTMIGDCTGSNSEKTTTKGGLISASIFAYG